MEAACSCETSVDFQRTTRRYIPQDSKLRVHKCLPLVPTLNHCLYNNFSVNVNVILRSILCPKRSITLKFSIENIISISNFVGFEALTAVVMNTSIFCIIMSFSRLKVNRRFGRTCRLHLQGRRISQARN
jgi:hypothetical protein